MMRALNAQLLKSFPILEECLPMRLSNPTYLFPSVGNSRGWEILFKENPLHAIPILMKSRRMVKNHAFAVPFKEKRKA